MLRSLVRRLRCPACAPSDFALRLCDFDSEGVRDAAHVINGVLVCDECHAFYTIEDELAELVTPALQDQDARTRFCTRFADALRRNGLAAGDSVANAADTAAVEEQLTQRKHFDWYAQNQTQSYQEYQHTPFWRAADAQTLRRWRPRVKPDSWILDIGCADGRGGFYFTGVPGTTLIGFDISRKMVANAIERAHHQGFNAHSSFLVADATRPPFASSTFDIVITFGVLHHLPDPRQSTHDIQKLLVPGGVHLAFENNESAARPLFDMMMKWLPLWTEEAGREPLISQSMVRDWTQSLPVRFTVATSVFVPPHLLNWLGHMSADIVLRATDAVAGLLPFVRDQGGLIVFELEKKAGS